MAIMDLVSTPAMSAPAPHMSSICQTVTGHLVQVGMLKTLSRLLMSGLAQSSYGGAVTMSKTTLSASLSLAARPLTYTDYSQQMVSLYTLHILSVPGLVHHVASLCPQSGLLGDGKEAGPLVLAVVRLLAKDQQLRIHFNALEGSYALCLTANLIQLVSSFTRLEGGEEAEAEGEAGGESDGGDGDADSTEPSAEQAADGGKGWGRIINTASAHFPGF